MQTWKPAHVTEWVAWCHRHIGQGGAIADYIPATFDTFGLVVATDTGMPEDRNGISGIPPLRAIPIGTIRHQDANPETCPLYMPNGTIWLPDGPINPDERVPVPVFTDTEFWLLPGYHDLVASDLRDVRRPQ